MGEYYMSVNIKVLSWELVFLKRLKPNPNGHFSLNSNKTRPFQIVTGDPFGYNIWHILWFPL